MLIPRFVENRRFFLPFLSLIVVRLFFLTAVQPTGQIGFFSVSFFSYAAIRRIGRRRRSSSSSKKRSYCLQTMRGKSLQKIAETRCIT